MTLIVTWLWQGLAIACITALALKATPRLNAATRHVIWWLALAAVLAIPVVHFAAPQAETPSMPEVMKSASVGAVMLVLPALPGAVTTGLIAFWAFTLVFGLIRIARSCHEVGRLKRTSVSFDAAREARLTMWVSARDSGRRQDGASNFRGAGGRLRIGTWRAADHPRLEIMVEALSDDELDEIVMHEQAHLERRDDWLRLLQAIASSIAGLHPAMRFILRQIDADCEAACDDRVVARTGDARRYAWTLAAAASAAVEGNELGLTPAATGTAAALRRRVRPSASIPAVIGVPGSRGERVSRARQFSRSRLPQHRSSHRLSRSSRPRRRCCRSPLLGKRLSHLLRNQRVDEFSPRSSQSRRPPLGPRPRNGRLFAERRFRRRLVCGRYGSSHPLSSTSSGLFQTRPKPCRSTCSRAGPSGPKRRR